MNIFYFNDGEMTLPDNWEDKTVVALSYPSGAEQSTASFTITRDAAGKDLNLATYVDRQLQTGKTFPKFKLLRHGETFIDGHRVEQIEFSWQTPDKIMIHQMQSIIQKKDGVFLIFTVTATAERFQDFQESFNELLKSIKLRQER